VVDIVVIGAGVAGLAAAGVVRRAGLECVVLEAGSRVGGRAFPATPAALGGAPIDLGAAWLHNAETNPLVRIGRARGERLINSDAGRSWQTRVDGRPATAEEQAEYDATWQAFSSAVERRLTSSRDDMSLAEAAGALSHSLWSATVLAWEGAIIGAVDADEYSARDWLANPLDGGNMQAPGGLGAFIERVLGSAAGDIRLNTPVRLVRWNGARGAAAVEVVTNRGSIAAHGCIVTVSTGVLAAGSIRFVPTLPVSVREAIEALPMGLATKVALRIRDDSAPGLPGPGVLDHRVSDQDEPLMVFACQPLGHDHVVGYIGGRAAWSLVGPGRTADGVRLPAARS
jgi:monoamine oxidase